MDMDREGLLNSEGLWNKRGILLGGSIALAAIVGFNYFFFEQMLGALGLFAVAWLALLTAVFVLVLVERAAEWGFVRLAEVLGPLPAVVRRLRVHAHFSALRERLAAALAPLPRFALGLDIPARLSALRPRLAAPLRRWKRRWLDEAEARDVGRIDDWRRRLVRQADSRSSRHRRAA